jgi:hypothetical protein
MSNGERREQKPVQRLVSFWVTVNLLRRLCPAYQQQVRQQQDVSILKTIFQAIIGRNGEADVAADYHIAFN